MRHIIPLIVLPALFNITCRGRPNSAQLSSKDFFSLDTLQAQPTDYIKYELDPSKALTYAKFKNKVLGAGVTDVDSLLKFMKSDSELQKLLNQFVLVYKSNSLEESDITPMRPRVITHADLLFLSFTEKLVDRDEKVISSYHNNVQMFEFDPVLNDFFPRSLNFANNKPEFDDEPKICGDCHGTHPRPIWRDYSVWPGVYGSDGDVIYGANYKGGASMSPRRYEGKLFNQFLSGPAKTGRYQYLTFADPVADSSSYAKYVVEGEVSGELVNMPNTNLTFHLYQLNYRRIASAICKGKYNKGSSRAFDEIVVQLTTMQREYNRLETDFINSLAPTDRPETYDTSSYQEGEYKERAADFAPYIQKYGDDALTWSLSYYPDKPHLRSIVFNAASETRDGKSHLLQKYLIQAMNACK